MSNSARCLAHVGGLTSHALLSSQVNEEHALDVGASVEVRCHDKQHTGGWVKARILQVDFIILERESSQIPKGLPLAHPN